MAIIISLLALVVAYAAWHRSGIVEGRFEIAARNGASRYESVKESIDGNHWSDGLGKMHNKLVERVRLLAEHIGLQWEVESEKQGWKHVAKRRK